MSTGTDHVAAVESLIEVRLFTPAVVRATDFAADVIRAKQRTAAELQAAVDGLDRVLAAYRA